MSTSERLLLTRIQLISRLAVLAGVVISLPLSLLFPGQLSWQIVLAVVALAVGIPHGAVDHMIAVPRMSRWRKATFFASYLLVTGLVIWFIITFNLLGFQIIVVLSALHFGFGDASFVAECDRRSGSQKFPKIWYSLAAGFTPVLIPLVNSQSAAALQSVNPALVGWSGPVETQLLVACICLNLVATVILFARRRPREALDLVLLLALATFAPPLVAFAIYFGFWHALRHTARLSLELESARHQHELGRPWVAFGKAVLVGLPSVIVVLGFTMWLGFVNGFQVGPDFLWYLLAVIWALTVPHMILTARIDVRALRAPAVVVSLRVGAIDSDHGRARPSPGRDTL
jgi:Brp/Blh family beta-carotene 15,15'-monooxygenase